MTHRKQITDSINKYLDMARALYPDTNIPNPKISFDMKGGSTFGQARYGAGRFAIRINDKISAKYLDDAINDTAPHEVAHLVAYKVYGRCQGHGPNWQRIMRQFGVAANRCASGMDTLEFRIFKAQTKHHFHCGNENCVHKMSGARKNKMVRGAAYQCRKTGGRIDINNYIESVRKSAATRKAEAYARAGIPLPGAAPKPAKAARKVKTTRPTSLGKPGTKKARAEEIYRNSIEDRPTIIKRFMRELDMKEAGASTYYANCKKKFG